MLIVATDHGVATFDDLATPSASWGLDGQDVTSVIARVGVVLAGTRDGVFRSDDHGRSWERHDQGLTTPLVRWMAFDPQRSDREFAGVEPAGIFRSGDGGGTWEKCPEIDNFREVGKWFLPYSPEAGCVRGFAFHGSRAYAAVEVGGVLRSDDGGESWRLAKGSTGAAVFEHPPPGFVHADVHSVAGHPDSPESVFAATAEGLYTSHDGGDTWTHAHVGSYCRAVWVDPENENHLVLSPADSVSHMNGRIEESADAGQTWTVISDGLDLPWPNRMVERFVQLDGRLLAITNDGRLYASDVGTWRWERLLPDLAGINAVTDMA